MPSPLPLLLIRRWELLALTRRTLLVVVDVSLFLDVNWKYASFVLLNFLYLMLHALFRPFGRDLENLLETVSLTILVVLSVILTASPPPFPLAAEIAVSILVLAPLLGFVILFVLVATKKISIGKRNKVGFRSRTRVRAPERRCC